MRRVAIAAARPEQRTPHGKTDLPVHVNRGAFACTCKQIASAEQCTGTYRRHGASRVIFLTSYVASTMAKRSRTRSRKIRAHQPQEPCKAQSILSRSCNLHVASFLV